MTPDLPSDRIGEIAGRLALAAVDGDDSAAVLAARPKIAAAMPFALEIVSAVQGGRPEMNAARRPEAGRHEHGAEDRATKLRPNRCRPRPG